MLQQSSKFKEQLQQILDHNSNGEVVEAVNAYEELKKNHLHELDVPHYNQIISSFAPRKLMFKWFQPYKDFVDMYYEAGKFRNQEVKKIKTVNQNRELMKHV